MRLRTLLLSACLISLPALAASGSTHHSDSRSDEEKELSYKGQKQVNKAHWEKSKEAARHKYLRAKAIAEEKAAAVARGEKRTYAIVDVDWENKEREAFRAASIAKAQWKVHKNSRTKAAYEVAKAELERVRAQGDAERQIARAQADAVEAKANATAMYEKTAALAQAKYERADADAARAKADAEARIER